MTTAVHPHGCGETVIPHLKKDMLKRFIPTGVGKLIFSVTQAVEPIGSSPRVWGN